jgi:hypothetical protein
MNGESNSARWHTLAQTRAPRSATACDPEGRAGARFETAACLTAHAGLARSTDFGRACSANFARGAVPEATKIGSARRCARAARRVRSAETGAARCVSGTARSPYSQ